MADDYDKDLEYLPNYKPDNLYVQPATLGAYVTLLAEDEELVLDNGCAVRTSYAIYLQNRLLLPQTWTVICGRPSVVSSVTKG